DASTVRTRAAPGADGSRTPGGRVYASPLVPPDTGQTDKTKQIRQIRQTGVSMRQPLRTLAAAAVAFAAALAAPAAAAVAAPAPAPAAQAKPPASNPYGDPNLVSMFDGKTLTGWTQAAAGEWSVVNGAIHGNGTARGWIYYNVQQAGTFRWIFDVRQV